VVLIGLGPVQSRSFSGFETGLPNTSDGDATDGNPWVISHGTHTHESRYGF